MEFIAINLNDFHNNQKDEPRTEAEMMFVDARDIGQPNRHLKSSAY
ncbi:hypothetical protein [Faecalicatena contorta]|uniref:Uncharacterized protein n=1 Tax=Faecalicatena contorta TaxID=39482 RepID=A0A315ZPR5_9FIRM|nr:hypothetical protein [Faecalicatena contorta]PWJ46878.1 hypothetical protein A8805_12613 [Faecalicatena contorta]SUQ16304.1 hypothetical protein SAMN05216529_12613 [Faecalicatena contorta]